MSGTDRPVISGIGVVSPLGTGAGVFWDALCAGRTAIAEIRRFDPRPQPPRLGAEVAPFAARDFLPPALVRRMDRLSQMICVAAVLAAADAGLGADGQNGDDLAVVVGSSLGNLTEAAQFLERVFTKGPSLANPMLFPNLVMNAPASQVAMALGWRGPNLTVSCGEISGEVALQTGVDLVRRGRCRAVVVAAGEELSEIVFHTLKELGHLSPRRRGRERSAPFDVQANGPVLGEGAAAVVVETPESAERRGASIQATIERIERFTVPSPSPHLWPRLDAAAKISLPPRVPVPDLVFCGADSSPERDSLELSLLKRLVPAGSVVYSLAGAVGSQPSQGLSTLVAAVLALRSGAVPPLLGLEQAPADTGLSFPQSLRCGEWLRALVLGVARGGAGAVIELKREVSGS
jgi:3-oxoacyl-[acyl-carrier-protein] synthase II